MIKKFPIIDIGSCSECGGCIEIAPDIFRYNHSTGLIEVIDILDYPESLVDESIKNCPKDCIFWEGED
jgi:ferredoxin